MVDFSFIVSLYVSDLPNVTISTVTVTFIVSLYVSDLSNVTISTVTVTLFVRVITKHSWYRIIRVRV